MDQELVAQMAVKASESCSKADSLIKANRLYLNRKLADSIHEILEPVWKLVFKAFEHQN
jgi:hypothetical protein